ncbi:MAG: sigma-54-dependent Fis family transcriptional regulator [Firmicutes bacterium]|nr:sigma-54-dependent Fis family transcriptional regulator [Bacillota bacterium]
MGIFILDSHGNIIYSNSNAAQIQTLALSAAKEVLNSKQPLKRYMEADGYTSMVLNCKPLLNSDEDLEYVIATSFLDTEFLPPFHETVKEKQRLASAVTYLSQCDALSSVHFFSTFISDTGKKALNLAEKASACYTPVILYGSSGIGKETLARRIHDDSAQRKGPFIPINLHQISHEQMEKVIFGNETGLLALAAGGTLYLNHIDCLSKAAQAKLLHILELEEHTGNNSTAARIIGATCSDLWKLVEADAFRQDLYYLLNVLPIQLYSLQERQEDILPMANFFLSQITTGKFYHNHINPTLADSTLDFFKNYSWPENLDEMERVIRQLALFADNKTGLIDIADICQKLSASLTPTVSGDAPSSCPPLLQDYSLPFKQALRRFEYDYVTHVIDRCNGNLTKAAKELGLHRSSLYNILNR